MKGTAPSSVRFAKGVIKQNRVVASVAVLAFALVLGTAAANNSFVLVDSSITRWEELLWNNATYWRSTNSPFINMSLSSTATPPTGGAQGPETPGLNLELDRVPNSDRSRFFVGSTEVSLDAPTGGTMATEATQAAPTQFLQADLTRLILDGDQATAANGAPYERSGPIVRLAEGRMPTAPDEVVIVQSGLDYQDVEHPAVGTSLDMQLNGTPDAPNLRLKIVGRIVSPALGTGGLALLGPTRTESNAVPINGVSVWLTNLDPADPSSNPINAPSEVIGRADPSSLIGQSSPFRRQIDLASESSLVLCWAIFTSAAIVAFVARRHREELNQLGMAGASRDDVSRLVRRILRRLTAIGAVFGLAIGTTIGVWWTRRGLDPLLAPLDLEQALPAAGAFALAFVVWQFIAGFVIDRHMPAIIGDERQVHAAEVMPARLDLEFLRWAIRRSQSLWLKASIIVLALGGPLIGFIWWRAGWRSTVVGTLAAVAYIVGAVAFALLATAVSTAASRIGRAISAAVSARFDRYVKRTPVLRSTRTVGVSTGTVATMVAIGIFGLAATCADFTRLPYDNGVEPGADSIVGVVDDGRAGTDTTARQEALRRIDFGIATIKADARICMDNIDDVTGAPASDLGAADGSACTPSELVLVSESAVGGLPYLLSDPLRSGRAAASSRVPIKAVPTGLNAVVTSGTTTKKIELTPPPTIEAANTAIASGGGSALSLVPTPTAVLVTEPILTELGLSRLQIEMATVRWSDVTNADRRAWAEVGLTVTSGFGTLPLDTASSSTPFRGPLTAAAVIAATFIVTFGLSFTGSRADRAIMRRQGLGRAALARATAGRVISITTAIAVVPTLVLAAIDLILQATDWMPLNRIFSVAWSMYLPTLVGAIGTVAALFFAVAWASYWRPDRDMAFALSPNVPNNRGPLATSAEGA